MPSALKEITVSVYGRNHRNVAYPFAGKISLSNDGSTWVDVATFSGWTQTSSGELLGRVSCGNTTAYRYVKLTCTTAGSSVGYIALGYITVKGKM